MNMGSEPLKSSSQKRWKMSKMTKSNQLPLMEYLFLSHV